MTLVIFKRVEESFFLPDKPGPARYLSRCPLLKWLFLNSPIVVIAAANGFRLLFGLLPLGGLAEADAKGKQ